MCYLLDLLAQLLSTSLKVQVGIHRTNRSCLLHLWLKRDYEYPRLLYQGQLQQELFVHLIILLELLLLVYSYLVTKRSSPLGLSFQRIQFGVSQYPLLKKFQFLRRQYMEVVVEGYIFHLCDHLSLLIILLSGISIAVQLGFYFN